MGDQRVFLLFLKSLCQMCVLGVGRVWNLHSFSFLSFSGLGHCLVSTASEERAYHCVPLLVQPALLLLLQGRGGSLLCLHDNLVSSGKLLLAKDLLRAGGGAVSEEILTSFSLYLVISLIFSLSLSVFLALFFFCYVST